MWLLLGAPDVLPADERATRTRIQHDREIAVRYDWAQQVLRMVRHQDPNALDGWLAACASCGVAERHTCAAGLHQDYSAVHAALREPWSTGPVEGHVNRVKLIKRSMYDSVGELLGCA